MSLAEMCWKLALAAVAGAAVGVEREGRDHPAGVRTHMFVCVGSALITFVSIQLAGGPGERTRIASNIVQGIGFLGAGMIFRSGPNVSGLTTAAGIWVVCGIGMAVATGGGMVVPALVAALIMVASNRWLSLLEARYFHVHKTLMLRTRRDRAILEPLFEALERRRIEVHGIQWLQEESNVAEAAVELRLVLPAGTRLAELNEWLSGLEGVDAVEWR